MAFNSHAIVNELLFKYREGILLYLLKLLYLLVTEGIPDEVKEVVVRILIRHNDANSLSQRLLALVHLVFFRRILAFRLQRLLFGRVVYYLTGVLGAKKGNGKVLKGISRS